MFCISPSTRNIYLVLVRSQWQKSEAIVEPMLELGLPFSTKFLVMNSFTALFCYRLEKE
jgi:hypothetical protein